MIEYECKSCGNIILLDKEDEPFCSICRTRMTEIGERKGKKGFKRFVCPECGRVFWGNQLPYKCPFCNFTFPSTPLIKQEEKL